VATVLWSSYAAPPLRLAARRRQNCFLTLHISVVFEPVASISTPCCSTPWALQIPPSSDGFPPPVWGLAPYEKRFFADRYQKFSPFFSGKTWHDRPRGGPLAIPPTVARGHRLIGGIWGCFPFLEFFQYFWRPHLYTWGPHSTFIRYLGLSRSMLIQDTFWLRATVLELRAPKP